MRASTDILRPRRAAMGFTLIEVLFVVTIIILLVSLVIPTMTGIRKQLYSTRTLTMIQALETGCQQYQRDTGYYPGQRDSTDDPGLDPWGGGDSGELNGSEWLAKSLLSPPEGSSKWPNEGYVVEPQRMLAKDDDGQIITPDHPDERPHFVDGFLDPMTIHYYPSKLGSEGRPARVQYNPNHGLAKSDGPRGGSYTDDDVYFLHYIKADPPDREYWNDPPDGGDEDLNPDSLPVNDGQFILISPGPDRVYYTRDDVTNIRR